jgi:hypothetical protein
MLSDAAAAAEDVAIEAMQAAGAAVHDEMEAATVVKETQASPGVETLCHSPRACPRFRCAWQV